MLSLMCIVLLVSSAYGFTVNNLVRKSGIFRLQASEIEPEVGFNEISIKQQHLRSIKSSLDKIGIIFASIGAVDLALSIPSVADEQSSSSSDPIITHKVYLDIKIANYTEESVGTNRAASGSGRIVLGLYGKQAPKIVGRFLSLIRSNGSESPSYLGTLFSRINEDGLLEIEKIRGVEPVTIAGRDSLEYKGKLLDYEQIVETNGLKHDREGLLTVRALSDGAEFGITTRASPALDTFHVVFGRIIDGSDVLSAIEKIQTYSYKTTTGYGGKDKGVESNIADSWFENQKKFYVTAGQAFGDRRAVDRRGKLLRRVKIIGSGDV